MVCENAGVDYDQYREAVLFLIGKSPAQRSMLLENLQKHFAI